MTPSKVHRRTLRFGRVMFQAEAWVNRYPLSSSRLCFRISGHYDRKNREVG